MTIKIAFTNKGDPWTADPSSLLEPHLLGDVPEGVAWWRISLDPKTLVVSVLFPDLSDAQAEVKQEAVLKAKNDAEAFAAQAPITSLDFMNLFTDPELEAVYAAAASSVRLRIYLDKLKAATDVKLNNPITIAGVQALVAGSLVTADRAKAILLGQQP